MGEKRNAYKTLVGKPEGKKKPGIPRRRWVNNITIDLREIGCDGKLLSSCTIGSFSRRAQLRK
jgi:hypothetical protein